MRRAPRSVVLTAVMAALVTVAALAAVIVLRMQRDQAEGVRGAAPPSSSPADAAAACGDRPCEVLTSVPVGSTTVELLADAAGRNGRLRFLADGGTSVQETALAGMGVRLTQRSLSCAKGTTSACLVRGGHDGGVVGEVFVARGGGWEPVEQPYFSSAAFLDLVQVTGNGNAEVAVAQMPDCAGSAAECAGAPIVVEVFGLDGTSEGCTPPYGALTQLPGWPDVDLTDGDLQTCG